MFFFADALQPTRYFAEDMTFSVRQVEWTTHSEPICRIRTDVFIREMEIPENDEWDGRDVDALHVLAVTGNDEPVGTGRLLATGQIGRMAVLKHARNRGVGSAMLKLLLQQAAAMSLEQVFLKAQLNALRFYEQHGFIVSGPAFRDAGLPHRKMIYNLD